MLGGSSDGYCAMYVNVFLSIYYVDLQVTLFEWELEKKQWYETTKMFLLLKEPLIDWNSLMILFCTF